MNDNAKCAGNGCPVRETCDRFVRPAVDGQAWGEPTWEPAWNSSGMVKVCVDWMPVPKKGPVQPHGGAREEGDGA